MMTDFEQRLRDSLRAGAAQARPAQLSPVRGWPAPSCWTRFERRLRDSLRYGAAKVDSAKATKASGAAIGSARPGPAAPSRQRRGLVVVLAAAMVVLVTAAPVVWQVWRSALVRSSPIPLTAPLTAPADPAWQVTVGLTGTLAAATAGPLPGDSTISARAGSYAYLVIRVTPSHPDGKTYLEQWLGGGWVRRGAHNTDQSSREVLAVRAPAAGLTASYRLYVPAASGHRGAYSTPVQVRAAS